MIFMVAKLYCLSKLFKLVLWKILEDISSLPDLADLQLQVKITNLTFG